MEKGSGKGIEGENEGRGQRQEKGEQEWGLRVREGRGSTREQRRDTDRSLPHYNFISHWLCHANVLLTDVSEGKTETEDGGKVKMREEERRGKREKQGN